MGAIRLIMPDEDRQAPESDITGDTEEVPVHPRTPVKVLLVASTVEGIGRVRIGLDQVTLIGFEFDTCMPRRLCGINFDVIDFCHDETPYLEKLVFI